MECYFTFFWAIRNFFNFTSIRLRNKLPPSVWLRNTGDRLLFFNSTSGTIRKPKHEQRQTRNEDNGTQARQQYSERLHSQFELTIIDFICQDQSSLTSKHAVSEEDLIKQAYEEFIKNLFRNFYDTYTTSNSSTQEKAAEQVFQNAVKAARKARDRALAILPK